MGMQLPQWPKRILSFRKSPLLIIVTILIAVMALLIFVDYSQPNGYWWQDYIRGTFTETIGIIVTLVFVERIFAAQQKKDEKAVELKQIQRLHRIIGAELQKCIQYASFMTQKPGEMNYTVSKGFDFNRLEIYYIPSLTVFDGTEQAYKLFSASIERMMTAMRAALVTFDFKYFSDIEALITVYLDFMSIGTPFGALDTLENNRGLRDCMVKMIKEIPSGTTPKYEDYPSNMMCVFIRLYHIINFHINFEAQYSNRMAHYSL